MALSGNLSKYSSLFHTMYGNEWKSVAFTGKQVLDKLCSFFFFSPYLAVAFSVKLWQNCLNTPHTGNVWKTMANLGTVLRFGRSLDFIQAALKSVHLQDPLLRLSITLSKINQAFYLLFDHFLWFNSVGALKLDRQWWSELSSKFYLTTLILNTFRDLYGILSVIQQELSKRKERSQQSEYKNGDTGHRSVSRRPSTVSELLLDHIPLVLDTVKNVFDLPIPLCTLKFMQLSPAKQGMLGLVSSSIAVATVWNPKLKLVPS